MTMTKNALILVLLMAPSAAFAVSAPATLRAPVVVPAIGFSAALNDGRVIAKWKRYKRDDFYSYQLLKSEKDADPVYVPKQSLFSTLGIGDLVFEDGRLSAGTWHYRLVVVTVFGDLWVSPVVTVVIAPGDLKRAVPTVADFE